MQYKQPHTSQVGRPTGWNVTVSQRLTYRSESSEPHIKLPLVGIWHWKEEPLEHLALKASGTRVQELLGEMETPFLTGTTDFHVHWVPGQSKGSIGIHVGSDCNSWRISWENKG